MLDSYNSLSRPREFHFCKPKLIIQYEEGRRKILGLGWGEEPTGIFLQNQSSLFIQSRYRGFTTLCFEFDYLRALSGPGKGTKLSYNILTLSNEYQFISLSTSVTQD